MHKISPGRVKIFGRRKKQKKKRKKERELAQRFPAFIWEAYSITSEQVIIAMELKGRAE